MSMNYKLMFILYKNTKEMKQIKISEISIGENVTNLKL